MLCSNGHLARRANSWSCCGHLAAVGALFTLGVLPARTQGPLAPRGADISGPVSGTPAENLAAVAVNTSSWDARSNCGGNTQIDARDVLCCLNAWAAGC